MTIVVATLFLLCKTTGSCFCYVSPCTLYMFLFVGCQEVTGMSCCCLYEHNTGCVCHSGKMLLEHVMQCAKDDGHVDHVYL